MWSLCLKCLKCTTISGSLRRYYAPNTRNQAYDECILNKFPIPRYNIFPTTYMCVTAQSAVGAYDV